MRAVAIAVLCCCLSSCGFAVKHPAITAGIVGGVVTLGSCELASADQKACFLYSGGAALGLGLVVAAAMWLGTYEEEAVPAGLDDENRTGPEPEPEPDRDLNPEPGTGSGTPPPPATAPPTTTPPATTPPATAPPTPPTTTPPTTTPPATTPPPTTPPGTTTPTTPPPKPAP